jgi:predicted Zn finger-like uncharacterized protein
MAKIKVSCPSCQSLYSVDESLLGKKGRCKKCNSTFRLSSAQGHPAAGSASQGSPSDGAASGQSARVGEARSFASEGEVPAVWRPGDVILDLYEVKNVLGEGGMGKVYKVHHRGWNIDLAVKSPRAEILGKPDAAENFARECETWVNLGLHPHVVGCHYVRRLGGVPRVFAEYVEGGSLRDWIKDGRLYDGGPQTALGRILDVAIQFAWGLHYAHEQGLIHQDVKPANLMMTPDGTAKVTDFGLAKARAMAGETATLAAGRTILVSSGGMTPAYCSPEQTSCEPLSRKTDTWSWAVSVLEMFTGDVTWPSGSVADEALEGYLQAGAGDERIPAMPAGVADLLRRCFQRQPQARPDGMPAIVLTLRQLYRAAVGEDYARPEPVAAELLADGLNNRALSLLDLGKKAEAERVWEVALRHDGHHAEAIYNLGLVRCRDTPRELDLLQQLQDVCASAPDDWHKEFLLAQACVTFARVGWATHLAEKLEQTSQPAAIAAARRLRQQLASSDRCLRTFEGHTESVDSVCLSGDGRYALSGSADNTMRLWELSTGRCLRTFAGHTEAVTSDAVTSACLSGDGRYALSRGSWDNTLRLWELSTGRCLRTFAGHTGTVNSVCLSGDGRHALSGSEDGELRLWEVNTGRCLRTFVGHRRPVFSVSLSGDGRFALSGSGHGWMRLWQLSTGRCLRTWKAKEPSGDIPLEEPDQEAFDGTETFTLHSVCLSRDGRYALSGGDDGTLRLWELSTGRCLRTFKGPTPTVFSVCLSGDGRYALSGGDDGTLRLWELGTGRCLRTFGGHTDPVSSVCLSADGRYALSGSWDKTLRLWALPSTFEKVLPLEPSRLTGAAAAVAADRGYRQGMDEGRRALERGDAPAALRALREARGQPGCRRRPEALALWTRLYRLLPRASQVGGWQAHVFEGHTASVRSVFLSGGGRYALSGGGEDKTVRLWEVATGRCLRIFKGHTDQVWSVCLSSDGRYALSASRDKTLRLWEAATGRCLRAFEGHEDYVFSVCLSDDGRYALSGSKDVRLWELRTGRCLRTFERHSESVWSVCLSGDGRYALSGSQDSTLRLWELGTGRCLRTFEGHTEGLWTVCLSSDGRYALSGSQDKTLRLWEVGTGRCLRAFEGHTDQVLSVCLSSDGRYALSGSSDGTLRLWELSTGRCLRTFTTGASSVCLSADGRYALSGGWDKTLRLWELDWELEERVSADWDEAARPHLQIFLTRQTPGMAEWSDSEGPEAGVYKGHTHSVSSVCLSGDARYALSGSLDMTLRLWELSTDRCLQTFEGHTSTVLSVCLSSDERHALSGSHDNTLRLWELGTGRCLRTFEGHRELVSSVCLSGDGRYALSGSWDNTLRLWELGTGRCLRIFKGHTKWVNTVCLSGDGRHALSGSNDKTLRLWELGTGRCLRTFEGHTEWVNTVCLSGDGHHALSGSDDRMLRLWELGTGRCLRTFEGHRGKVKSVCLSADGRYALSGSEDKAVRLWELGTGRCLRTFEGHRGHVWSVCLSGDGRLAVSGSQDDTLRLWELDSKISLPPPPTRRVKASWNEQDFERLLYTLGCAGFGWLRPEGVRRELEKMAANWTGPPPFPGT